MNADGVLNHHDPAGEASPRTGWPADVRAPSARDKGPNVGTGERIASGLGGLVLLCWAAGRDGAGAKLGIVAAGGLLCRAVTGYSWAKRALQPSPYEDAVARSRRWPAATVSEYAVTIARPREELYGFWRDFSNLPRFMRHVMRIEVMDERQSRWTVKAPLGKSVQWTSTITEDLPNERIAWETDEEADVPNAGWVEFHDAPGNRGTEVRAVVAYQPPAGHLGRVASRVFLPETPSQQMTQDLRRLKQIMETGEAAVSPLQPQA
ncbi:MAG: SRPBCC family protein [Pigmentiphaga sp.]|uniref:SRPBCC family protein n=1 Tax=Pigmentiphaga sp. TaxID=1977564 RepID=UPI0029AA255F|nr:SRPBCC family protein [Pigmentiphaga sp.]MDX3905128.1 SRPBCC family protein [Pigmentiphaga sp.]